jgi:hypothetical protein
MLRSSCRAVVLVVFIVVVVIKVGLRLRSRLRVVGLGMKDMPDPELVEVVIRDNLGAYKEIFDGCRV